MYSLSAATPDFALSGASVDVWSLRAEREPYERNELFGLLSPAEQEKALRYRFDPDRARSITARGALRRLLSRYTGAPPASLAIEDGPHGKPALRGYPIAFNVSHSGDWIAVAVAAGREVGVDLERIRPDVSHPDLAVRFFTARENAWLDALPLADRLRGFYRLWTIKEALLKAVGTGLSTPLNRVDIAFSPQGVEIGGYPGWYAVELPAEPGYVSSLVLEGLVPEVRFWTERA